MTLAVLLDALGSLRPEVTLDATVLARSVTSLAYDSRQVVPGALFVTWKGRRMDGAAFGADAVARGAVAVVADSSRPPGVEAPWIEVRDARTALARLAAEFYGHPDQELLVVGITGTNGKTTTAYLLSAILDRADMPCGRLGTVSYRVGNEERDAPHTTPEAPDLQRLLREVVDRGCRACAIEVSSHALALRRVDATRFSAAVFTNLTRDHLDFHRDMETYFAAKRRLFDGLPPDGVSVVNADDPAGVRLVPMVSRPVTYAIDRPADVTPGPLDQSFDGLGFDLRTPRGSLRIGSRLVGRPNVYNILAAASAAMALDVPFSAIERGIADVRCVPGRFEVISSSNDDVRVVVDYAHTDDALRNLLETARPLASGRLITVFGCGGDRDPTKRPLMGAVAARLSDVIVVTSDNPRSEDPEAIIGQITRGIKRPSDRPARTGTEAAGERPECLTIPDRGHAIALAISRAQPGDLVLVAGKGHEKSQVIGDRVLPFDDGEVARAALARRRAGSAVR
jgi:UDP-N-acetylmuramoyl-L-alanyl-D-glutamate--2,6-diaminopimelate ligase